MMGDYPLMVNAHRTGDQEQTQLLAIIAYNAVGAATASSSHKDSPF